MVKTVLNFCKSFLSGFKGFKDRSKRFLVELKFDQEIEGQRSLKVELRKVTKVTEKGKEKAICYVMVVETGFDGRLTLFCLPKMWLKATESNFTAFRVYCKLDGILVTLASATIKEIEDKSEILPIAQCA